MHAFFRQHLRCLTRTLTVLSVLVLWCGVAYAQANPQINYQGKLTTPTGVAVEDGTYNMRFWLIDSPSAGTSTAVWTESLTDGDRVTVTNGLFSVMLGATAPLTGVNFNQTLYLAVEIGGVGASPAWDGEMSPRKILGSVPAAFEARRLDGVASSSFLRSDEVDTLEATSSNPLLTLVQNGAGAILRLFSGASEVFTVLNSGYVGIGTTTPWVGLTIDNDIAISGGLYDNNYTSGQAGQLLQSTNGGIEWVSTSTLGFGTSNVSALSDLTDVTIAGPVLGEMLSYDGAQWVNRATSTLGIALSDTTGILAATRGGTGTSTVAENQLLIGGPGNTWRQIATSSLGISSGVGGSGATDRVAYFSGASTLTSDAGFTFSSNRLRTPVLDMTGLTGTSTIAMFGGQPFIRASSTFANIYIGLGAGSVQDTGFYNVALGTDALRVVNNGYNNTAIGFEALYSNTQFENTAVGTRALRDNTTGQGNAALGVDALTSNTTGLYNQAFGQSALSSNTIGNENVALGRVALRGNTVGSFNVALGNEALRNALVATGTVAIGFGSGEGPAFSSHSQAFNTFIGYQSANAITTGSENTVIGRGAGFSLSSGARNIFIGASSSNALTTGSNNIAIGYNINLPSNTASNQLSIGNLIFGTGINGEGTTISTGNIGIGTTSPSAKLTVAGDLRLTGRFADSASSTGSVGNILSATTNGTAWLSTSTLGIALSDTTGILAATRGGTGTSTVAENQLLIGGPGNTWRQIATSSLGLSASFTTSAQLAALLSDETGTGFAVFSDSPTFTTLITTPSVTNAGTLSLAATGVNIITASTNGSERLRITSAGNVGIGTTTPEGLLSLRREGVSGTSTVGIDQYLGLANTSNGAAQVGNRFNIVTTNTATTTIIGNLFRIQDSTTFGSTVRGIEVQTNRGTNTLGENTAISGFGRTFGVRGTTQGDAGAIFEPAGIYGETRGAAQGNAIRGYSASITTATLLSLFQDTSAFAGTGLEMNFGNTGGTFNATTSRFLDFQVAGVSRFVVNASGTLTIGDGINDAGLLVQGNARVTGAFFDSTNASGTSGMVLQSTGAGTQWVATSTLGLVAGGSGAVYLASTSPWTTGDLIRVTSNGVVESVATSTLGIALSDTTGILAATRGGTGTSTVAENQLLIGGVGNTWTQLATSSLGLSAAFSNSAQLAALLSDETGTGLAVFNNAPTFTGNVVINNINPTSVLTVGGALAATGNIDSGAQFLGNAADTAAVPGYSWTGDTDTGIFRPAVNVVAFSTLGTERMRILSTGRVGIGTAVPLGLLQVGSTTANPDAMITFGEQAEATEVFIPSISQGSITTPGTTQDLTLGTRSSNGAIYFFTGNNGSNSGPLGQSTNAARMVVTAGGNVGIGTTTPTRELHLSGSGSTEFRIDTTATSDSIVEFAKQNVLTWSLRNDNTGTMGTDGFVLADSTGNEKLAIGQAGSIYLNGNVGIGTTSPSARLTVAGDLRVTGRFADSSSSTGSVGNILSATANGTAWLSTSTLGIALSDTTGILAATRGGTGTSTVAENQLLIGGPGNTWRQIATSSLGISSGVGGSGATDRIAYFSGASTLTSDSNFTFSSNNLNIAATGAYRLGGTDALRRVSTNYFIAGATPGSAGSSDLYNIAVGEGSLAGLIDGAGNYNIAVGFNAGNAISSADDNVAIGQSALSTANSNRNVAIGSLAGQSIFSGTENVVLGYNADSQTSSGAANVVVGAGAKAQGSFNTILGSNINLNSGSGGNIIIGYDADAISSTAFEQLNIGNLLFGTGLDGTGTTLSTGNIGIGTTSPSAKLTVQGDLRVTGRFADSASSTGSLGNILSATANGTAWLATSSLGLSTAFTTSAGLAALLSDEVGTGFAVFNDSPTFTTLITTPSVTNAGTLSLSATGANIITASTNGSERLRITSDGNVGIGITPSQKLAVTGDQTTSGYLRVGSNSAPVNTTAGDLTATRLNVGNAAFSGTGFMRAGGTMTDTTGTISGIFLQPVWTPAGANTGQQRGLTLNHVINGTDQALVYASNFVNDYRATGSVSNRLIGVGGLGMQLSGNASNFGTINTASGGYFQPVVSFGNTVTGTITRAVGFEVVDSLLTAGQTITGQAGISIATLDEGTNNTSLLIGQTSVPTGNFGIYNASTNANYFAGNVGIGTSTPATKLDVWGSLRVGTSSTPLLTVDTAKSVVGIGELDPDAPLHVTGGNNFGQQIRAEGASFAFINVRTSSSDGKAGVYMEGDGQLNPWYMYADGDWPTNNLVFRPTNNINSGTKNTLLLTGSTGNVGISTSSAPARLTVVGVGTTTGQLAQFFDSAGAAKVTLLDSGNVGIGTTSPAARLAVTQSDNTATGGFIIAESGNTDFRSMYMNTSGVFSFFGGDRAGTLNTATLNAAGEWTNASDASYKENIETLDYGLDALMQLQPRTYSMKNTNDVRVGFIAQEVELVIPEVVGGVDGSKGISYGNLVAVVVRAVQELAEKVTGFAEYFQTKKVATEELCIEDVCIDKAQLLEMINNSGQSQTSSASAPAPVSNSGPGSSEAVAPDPVPEVALVEEGIEEQLMEDVSVLEEVLLGGVNEAEIIEIQAEAVGEEAVEQVVEEPIAPGEEGAETPIDELNVSAG